jgi:hypothetical protein
MRITILAAVALCPMLLHAQANSPAQPAVKSATLESRLTKPEAPGALPGATASIKTPVRVSTGVMFPKLIETNPIVESASWPWRLTEDSKIAVVKVLVGPDGKPVKVEMIKPLGAGMDKDILAAVGRYRFQPGTLDHQAVPLEVNLTVTILSRIQ